MKKELKQELKFCLQLWQKQRYCEFGGHTKCEQCATPYLLYKLITGKVLHGRECKKLSLQDWVERFKKIIL